VVYTVVEAEFAGYDPTYSEPTIVTGRTFNGWVNADSLSAGTVYRFVSGAYALGVDMSGNLISMESDPSNVQQQWRVEARGSGYVLKNVGYNYYLDADNNGIFTAGSASAAAAVSLSNDVLKIENRYLQLSSSGVNSSWYENNGTALSVTGQMAIEAMPGTHITVTNRIEAYVLPNTGGEGYNSSLYSLGGALTAAAASMCICEFGRKRRKKGEVENRNV